MPTVCSPWRLCCGRNPTWGNHRNIFADSGIEWKYYSYFDPKTVGLDFDGLIRDLNDAPDGSIVVLHGEPSATSAIVALQLMNVTHVLALSLTLQAVAALQWDEKSFGHFQ